MGWQAGIKWFSSRYRLLSVLDRSGSLDVVLAGNLPVSLRIDVVQNESASWEVARCNKNALYGNYAAEVVSEAREGGGRSPVSSGPSAGTSSAQTTAVSASSSIAER